MLNAAENYYCGVPAGWDVLLRLNKLCPPNPPPNLAISSAILACLDGVEDARLGDEVTVLGADGGDEITLNDVAAWQGRSPLEVLQMLAGRSERRFG